MKPKRNWKGTRNKTATATGYFCGIDIGGTFTDCVVRDPSGKLTVAKAFTTPENPAEGFFHALTLAAEKIGLGLEDLLSRTELLLHGMTTGTNALIERKGARTGLITTAGHADALIMMRSAGRSAGLPIQKLLHVSRHAKPEPLIPRRRIREVSERVDWSGEVVLPLNEAEAREAIQSLLDEGVEAIGICFLWGFLNPAHERRVRQMVEQMAPGVFVTCGHEVIAKPGEYERMAAVAINCFLGPLMSRYIRRIERRSAELGYRRPFLIMQSAGGAATADEVARKPLFTIGSGPTGGLIGTKFLADMLGYPNVIASDVGGTSFDVGLISDGVPLSSSESTINQYTFAAPHLDMTSIGSGGGSILWVDPVSRTLKVGPESAGADPGPACYRRNGQRPTVTDADLVLGFLDPDRFLGGRLQLDREASERTLRSVGAEIGMSPIETASAAVEIVEFQMAELMRQMTVQRGFDPRNFVVFSYGGAAGARAVTYARELGCRTVVVPLGSAASAWSALGVQSADVLHVYEQAELFIAPFDVDRIRRLLAEMEARGREQLQQDGIAKNDIRLDRSAEMKFRLQIHRVEVPIDSGPFDAKRCRKLEGTFIEKYERLYGRGSAFTAAGIEIGLLRVVARGCIRRPSIPKIPRKRVVKHVDTRRVWWRELKGWKKTPIYEYSQLGAGARVDGPAIVLMPETTVVVRPGAAGRMDEYGNLILNLGK